MISENTITVNIWSDSKRLKDPTDRKLEEFGWSPSEFSVEIHLKNNFG
jgi:hypothetical protein